jgi:colanic acid biosynthesis glycosyl transferase WcaI
MKILLYGINCAPEPVGIGKYTADLAHWLVEQGHLVHVITAPAYYPEWKCRDNRYRHESTTNIKIWRCPLWVPNQPRGLTRLLHQASFALSSLPVLLSSWGWRPDVVMMVAPSLLCAPGSLLLSRSCGKNTFSWLHIQDFELDVAFSLGMLKGRWLRHLAERWERWTLRHFDRVSTISGAMQQRAIFKSVITEKSILLPNWVDLNVIKPQSAEQRLSNPYYSELGIQKDQLVLLYSGSMNKKQGLEIILDAIRQLADLPHLLWVIAGEGPRKAELQAAAADIPNVRILPLQPTERLNDWFNLADIHLLPQKASAADLVLPSKLLGMLASGRPVVATTPAESELGRLAHQAGVQVEPDNSTAFASALRSLIGNRDMREKLGQAARRLAEKHFGREVVLSQLESELKQLGHRNSMKTKI